MSDKNIWICNTCAYEHDGEPADDFICPICGMDKSDFEKAE